MSESKYFSQGRKARSQNETRASCRYKAADIVRDWQAGWDAEDQRIAEAKAEHERERAILRWVDSTSYSQGERGKVEPRTWSLCSSRLGQIKVSITRRLYSTGWVIAIVGLTATGRHEHEIADLPAVDAKSAAVEYLRQLMTTRIAEIESALPVLNEPPQEASW